MTETLTPEAGFKQQLRKSIHLLKCEFNKPKQKNCEYDRREARDYDIINLLYEQINSEKREVKGSVAERKKLASEKEMEAKNIFQKFFSGWKNRMETKASIRRTKKLAK